ncbi:hypothetical protein [Streptomyces sp. ADI96-02]|uniref:hypothetical protein n=1 Tax=Streptomyces sp. ADI96-02 TaxID=1522760 RepID=UPI000F54D42A|nr:hypothetical protein [Streptomyces sp. ADI96-02]
MLLPSSRTSEERVCWRFSHLDLDGPWGLVSLDHERLMALLQDMAKFESQTMHELFHQGEWPGKRHDVHTLPNRVALARLDALGLSDMTQIWKLRIGSAGRLWGFLVGNVFHVVWWDARHEIWPTKR